MKRLRQVLIIATFSDIIVAMGLVIGFSISGLKSIVPWVAVLGTVVGSVLVIIVSSLTQKIAQPIPEKLLIKLKSGQVTNRRRTIGMVAGMIYMAVFALLTDHWFGKHPNTGQTLVIVFGLVIPGVVIAFLAHRIIQSYQVSQVKRSDP